MNMKNMARRIECSRLVTLGGYKLIAAFLFALRAGVAFAETDAALTYTWTGPASFSGYMRWDENDGQYWSGGDAEAPDGPLPKDGSDVVFDTTAQTTTLSLRLPTTEGFPRRFNSLVHRGKTGQTFSLQSAGKSGQLPLQLDNGGLKTDVKFPNIGDASSPTPIELLASQAWTSSIDPSSSDASSTWQCSFASGPDVEWTLNGAQAVFLSGGNSEGFLGKVRSSAALWLCHTNQFGRFGRKGLTLTSELQTPTLSPVPELVFAYLPGDCGAADCPTPLDLDLQRQGTRKYHTLPFIGVYTYDGTQDAEVRLTGALSGTVADGCLELGQTGGQVYSDIQWDRRNPGAYRSDQCRLVLAGDGSALVPAAAGAKISVSTVVALERENALGAGNAAFDVAVGSAWTGMQKLTPFLAGLVGRNGVTIGARILSRSNHTSNLGMGRPFVVLLGADDASEVRYTGALGLTEKPWFERNAPVMRFTAAKGGTARMEGYVHNPYHTQILGEGDVVFSCETNRFYADIDVRGGRLVLSNARALALTDAQNERLQTPVTINLGDAVPAAHDVDLLFAGVWPANGAAAGPGAIALGATDDGKAACRLTFTRSPGTIDGVQVKRGDVIVVNSMWTCQKNADLYANGVWKVVAEDCTVWERVDWLDDVAEVTAGHGLRVHVRAGEQFGGRAFFLANYESETYDRDDCRFSFGSKPLTFHDEAVARPDVGFLLDGAFTCKNPVVITDNRSTGVSELGGRVAGEAVFAGAITNRKGRVTFSAIAGGTVRVSGDLVAPEGVEAVYAKTGAGTVDLTEAQNFRADGYAVSDGVLKVAESQFAGRPSLAVTVGPEGSGTLEVEGDVDWTGRTIAVTLAGDGLARGARFTLVRASGTMTGQPTVTGLSPDDWTFSRVGSELRARFRQPGVVLFIR